MDGDTRLLLVRGEDLVTLGLHWADLTPGPPAAPGGPPVLVADGSRPTLVLTLPPQSTAEELFDPASSERPRARPSGPSELRVAVARGARVELSAAGVLDALRRHQGLETDLELPWGLHVAIAPGTAGDILVVDTPVEPAESPVAETGLWRARLVAAKGLVMRPLQPLRPADDLGGAVPVLDIGKRGRIVAESGRTSILPTTPEIELSPLGASATMHGSWPGFAWEHDLRLGRDMRVRAESSGVLYPFGHRAVLAALVERALEPADAANVFAGLRSTSVLLIAEPLRRPADHGARAAREFPFDEVQVLGTAFRVRPELGDPKIYSRQPKRGGQAVPIEGYGWPLASQRERLQLPVRCDGVVLSLPVIFVHDIDLPEDDEFPAFATLSSSEVQRDLADAWNASPAARVGLPRVHLDLVRSPAPRAGDVHEVNELVLAGEPVGGSFRPRVAEAVVDLPAMRTLLPGRPSRVPVVFDPDFLERGDAMDVALQLREPLGVDFTGAADRSGGLVAPAFSADVLSRTQGLVDRGMLRALPKMPGQPEVSGLPAGPPNPAELFKDAKLLGIPLARVMNGVPRPVSVDHLPKPLGLTPILEGGRPVGARMAWDVTLKDGGPLRVRPGTTFRMMVEYSPAGNRTSCRAERFDLVLPPVAGDLIRLGFEALTFTQEVGHPPRLEVTGLTVDLGGDLGLVKTLQKAVDLGEAAPVIRPSPTGISASYTLAVPEVPAAGAFSLRNIAVNVGVNVPFGGDPVVATLGFSSRDNPFTVSVAPFGGGGYLVFQIAEDGIRQLEASLDFGGTVAIGVGVASVEVHALGGVRFLLQGDKVAVTGFLRIGGSVDVLGLVSVTVELRVDLSYDGKVLSGRATAVVEIDVTFWSGSVNLDSGTITLAGAMAGPEVPPSAGISPSGPPPALPDWQKYRNAFAPSGGP